MSKVEGNTQTVESTNETYTEDVTKYFGDREVVLEVTYDAQTHRVVKEVRK